MPHGEILHLKRFRPEIHRVIATGYGRKVHFFLQRNTNGTRGNIARGYRYIRGFSAAGQRPIEWPAIPGPAFWKETFYLRRSPGKVFRESLLKMAEIVRRGLLFVGGVCTSVWDGMFDLGIWCDFFFFFGMLGIFVGDLSVIFVGDL